MKKIIICAFLALAVIATCSAQKEKENPKKRFALTSIKESGTFHDALYEYSYNEKGQLTGVSYSRTRKYDIRQTVSGKGSLSYDDKGYLVRFDYTTIVCGKEKSGYAEFAYDRGGNISLIRKVGDKDGKLVVNEERLSYDKHGLLKEKLVVLNDKPVNVITYKYDDKGRMLCEATTAVDTVAGLDLYGRPKMSEQIFEYDAEGNLSVWSTKIDGALLISSKTTLNKKKNYEDRVDSYYMQMNGKKTDEMFHRDVFNNDSDLIESVFKQKSMGINQKTTYSYDSHLSADVVEFDKSLYAGFHDFFPEWVSAKGHRLIYTKTTGKFYIMTSLLKGTSETFFEYKEL